MKELLDTFDESQLVLDLGAGGGSFQYARTWARVVALDLALPRNSEQTELRVIASAAAIPLPDGCIDLVICNNTLEHFEELDESLREIKRVLKADGSLWASLPDASSLDDRLYRRLFAGGGHVNHFSRSSFLQRAAETADLQELETRPLHTGFVFLQPPDPTRFRHYPVPARFLGWVPPPALRRMIRWMNLAARILDRRLGTRVSLYGWAFRLGQGSDARGSNRLPAHINVCFGCGASRASSLLSTRRFLFWRVYNCPQCGEANFWFPDQEPDAASERPPTRDVREARDLERLRGVAGAIFGPDDHDSVNRWVEFWATGVERASRMLELFLSLALIDLKGGRVLDLGCGTGDMAGVLKGRCRYYVGVDPTRHVISLAQPEKQSYFVEAGGAALPFPDQSFDYVFALDVLEHVQGGRPEQIAFLKELRRVISPVGMVFLSTPNRLYPYEGHTNLYFPQYLPGWLGRLYIQRFNPGFLKEHTSFSEITSLTPAALRRCLGESGLEFLHQLPCGADRADYLRNFPLRGLLSYCGLGWYPHAEFWGVLVHRDMKKKLRLKRPKVWRYEQSQPSSTGVSDFGSRIDFGTGLHNPQLGPGWYWHERDREGFRWTSDRAIAFLQTDAVPTLVKVHGYAPTATRLKVLVNDLLVGTRTVAGGSEFRLLYLVPFQTGGPDIWKVEIECDPTFMEEHGSPPRQLGVMIFSIEMV